VKALGYDVLDWGNCVMFMVSMMYVMVVVMVHLAAQQPMHRITGLPTLSYSLP